MPRPAFSYDQLVDKALAGLIAVMQAHSQGACRDQELLRAALALLYDGGDLEPFTTFWREAIRDNSGVVDATRIGHFQTMRGAYARIAGRHGREYW